MAWSINSLRVQQEYSRPRAEKEPGGPERFGGSLMKLPGPYHDDRLLCCSCKDQGYPKEATLKAFFLQWLRVTRASGYLTALQVLHCLKLSSRFVILRNTPPSKYVSGRSEQKLGLYKGPLSKAVVCESNITALLREAASFIPGYECNSPVAPSDFNLLISGYRTTHTALLGNLYCCTVPPHRGRGPTQGCHVAVCHGVLTAG